MQLLHLSKNSKLPFYTFDLDPKKSGCATRCAYSGLDFKQNGTKKDSICYDLNNYHNLFNARIEKLEKNLKLIKSANFVKVLKLEILATRTRQFRIFSGGDFPTYASVLKVIKLARECPKVEFWCSTSRDDYLAKLISQKKSIPKNLIFRLSNAEPLQAWPEALKEFWLSHGIKLSSTTMDPTAANCPASLDSNESGCNLCESCFFDDEVKYLIHGNRARKNARRLQENKKNG